VNEELVSSRKMKKRSGKATAPSSAKFSGESRDSFFEKMERALCVAGG
jgi:hypothetical protein